MNKTLSLAAVLAALTSAIHIFSGTPEIGRPLFQSELPQELKLLLYACWHMVSIVLVLSAFTYFISARSTHFHQTCNTVRFVSWLWIGSGLVLIAVALSDSGIPMLLKLPQWVLLLPVGVLGLWACSKPAKH